MEFSVMKPAQSVTVCQPGLQTTDCLRLTTIIGCRKGGRDCVYPETSATTKMSAGLGQSKRAQNSTRESPGSSSDEYEDISERTLPDIKDEDHFTSNLVDTTRISSSHTTDSSQLSGIRSSSTRNSSETPSLVQDKASSPTPSSEGSTGYATYQTLFNARLHGQGIYTGDKADWASLPQDVQFYLTYFQQNITHLHYSLKYDADDFIRTRYLDIALHNEALLYAIVGFSAFQRTLRNPHGRIQDFLQYYNKSVSLLLKSLKRGEKHNHGTILAMLQLATIEVMQLLFRKCTMVDMQQEFLGDWINLLGHQKAAYQILTELYNPQTIMQSGMSRIILGWYMRFDVFASLMGGFETVLSREWFSESFNFFASMTQAEPEVIHWKIQAALAQTRLLATDMSLLFSQIGKGEISLAQFDHENGELGARISNWKAKMDPALEDR